MKLARTPVLIGTVVSLGLGVLVSDSVTASTFGEWSVPLNLGPIVNSPFDDIFPHTSKDAFGVYFQSSLLLWQIERHHFIVEGLQDDDQNDPARGASNRFDQWSGLTIFSRLKSMTR